MDVVHLRLPARSGAASAAPMATANIGTIRWRAWQDGSGGHPEQGARNPVRHKASRQSLEPHTIRRRISPMKIPRDALVVLANGERCLLMRNTGLAFEPKLEKVEELDLELTNFSAG